MNICFTGFLSRFVPFDCVHCQNTVDEGYAATQILSQLHEVIIEEDLSDKQKSAITEKMAVSYHDS